MWDQLKRVRLNQEGLGLRADVMRDRVGSVLWENEEFAQVLWDSVDKPTAAGWRERKEWLEVIDHSGGL